MYLKAEILSKMINVKKTAGDGSVSRSQLEQGRAPEVEIKTEKGEEGRRGRGKEEGEGRVKEDMRGRERERIERRGEGEGDRNLIGKRRKEWREDRDNNNKMNRRREEELPWRREGSKRPICLKLESDTKQTKTKTKTKTRTRAKREQKGTKRNETKRNKIANEKRKQKQNKPLHSLTCSPTHLLTQEYRCKAT